MYEMGDEEALAVSRVLSSKKLFRYQTGEAGECDKFEGEFALQMNSRYSIIVSSGTNALIAALTALGVRAGDEVLVPAYTFVATAAAVLSLGATPIIVNIDERLGICPLDARNKINQKTKAMIVVHMDGLSANMTALISLMQEFDIPIVEDCAQAVGGRYKDRSLGSIGAIGTYSFNENKIISCGEGGAITTQDKVLYERLFRAHDLAARYNHLKSEPLTNHADFLGFSMRVSEIQGAIMRIQLKRLRSIIAQLNVRKNIYIEVLSNIPETEILLSHDPTGDCGTSLHLRLKDPLKALCLSQNLIKFGVPAIFPTARPAHVAWKWALNSNRTQAGEYKRSLSPSINILTRVLKLDLFLDQSLEETYKSANFLKNIALKT